MNQLCQLIRPVLADAAFVDDLMRSMDIAVGIVMLIAIIAIAFRKANGHTAADQPARPDNSSE